MNDKNKSEPATKADLKELATKADLQELALTTKTDLKKLEQATKADLKELALTTKADLKKLAHTVEHLAVELTKTQADVREIKYDMAAKMATKDDISRILSAIDTYTTEAISYRNRDTLRGRAVMDHTTKLSDHESRITALETGK